MKIESTTNSVQARRSSTNRPDRTGNSAAGGKRNAYSLGFKLNAVKLALSSPENNSAVARSLSVAPKTLSAWVTLHGPGLEGTDAMSPCEWLEFYKLQQRNRVLELELAILRKCGHLLRSTHGERFQFIREHQEEFEVRAQCRVLGVSVSGYYAWEGRDPSPRSLDDLELLEKITVIHEDSRQRYGSPRVHAELVGQGVKVSAKRVARLMREKGLRGNIPKKFKKTTLSDHARGIAPNLLDREFEVARPNIVWVGDITYVWTDEGWIYLAVLLDLYSRLVVGWSAAAHMRDELTLAALEDAVRRRGETSFTELLHHSDRGSQYASKPYIEGLEDSGITRSMSRKGNCWDNSVAESFFASLKKELVYRDRFQTRQEAYEALFEYIEVFYNRKRRHSHNEYLSPVDFESALN